MKKLSRIAVLLLFTACTREIPQGSPQRMAEYQQQYRPQYHFSPPKQWMNDPNGMVYYEGEYHLFYQHHPDSNVWGPMHWGHAVSKNLVRWENLPIALSPDELGYIFSGSAVVDWQNTAGFGTKDNPALVAIFTYHDAAKEKAGDINFQTQAIAYSTDRGRTWEKYSNNPVLNNPGVRDFRDPKVIWYAPKELWIMALAAKDHIRFYSSENLKDWKWESEFGKTVGSHGGAWECPDLFPLTVGKSEEEKWVLLVSLDNGGPNGGSATQYFVGDFDGKQFILDERFASYLSAKNRKSNDTTRMDDTAVWLDYGTDNYAGVTWSGIPEEESRRVFLGWMSNWQYAQKVPTTEWRNAMTIPRSLKLSDELLLLQQPINELKNLMLDARAIPELSLDSAFQLGNITDTHHFLFEVNVNEASNFQFALKNDKERVTFQAELKNNRLVFNRKKSGKTDFHSAFAAIHTAPIVAGDKLTAIEVFVDKSSIEIFINEGKYVFTALVFPEEPYQILELSAEGNAQISNFIYHNMGSIWISR